MTVPALSRRVAWLVVGAALVNAVSGALTAFLPDLLNGPPVMNGSAQGTGVVMALLGAPALLVAAWFAARGSWRGIVAVVGLLGYLLYNDVLFLLATPFNELFLLYCAGFASAMFAMLSVAATIDVHAIADEAAAIPARGLAAYIWLIVVLNAFVWLGAVVPGVLGTYPPAFLAGTGLTTNPIYAQDLSFWLPGAAIVGWLLWNRAPWGVVLGGAYLVYGLVEAVGVATDQWLGSSADPASTVATMGGAYLFVVIGLVGLVPAYFYLRPRTGAGTVALTSG
jgi:hypothetical protein